VLRAAAVIQQPGASTVRIEREIMENSGRLFEGDVIAPNQYLEIFTRTNNLEPEQELMLAILTDAIECIMKYCDEPVPMRAKLFNEAQEWLFDEDEKQPFSFLNVCETLRFDAGYLRRGIQAKMAAITNRAKEGPGSRSKLKRIGRPVRIRRAAAPAARPRL
jgi:hypothetical protein